MRHVDAYSRRAADNVDLLVCPNCRGDLAHRCRATLPLVFTAAAPVCLGILILNGTMRRPGMRPMIVSGLRYSTNSLWRFW
jgi:uncharacterized protein YbaR (Trm112 family)